MKPFSLDWWWAQYNVAQGLVDHYEEISSYNDVSITPDEKCIKDRRNATRYVDLRDYIRKRIQTKVSWNAFFAVFLGNSCNDMSSFDSPLNWKEDFKHENGKYTCKCYQCGRHFIGYKRRVMCKECSDIYDAS